MFVKKFLVRERAQFCIKDDKLSVLFIFTVFQKLKKDVEITTSKIVCVYAPYTICNTHSWNPIWHFSVLGSLREPTGYIPVCEVVVPCASFSRNCLGRDQLHYPHSNM